MNLKKILIIILFSLFLSFPLSVFIKTNLENKDFLNTIYTISGIMFSIGMGILCTINPDSIKNEEIYKAIRKNIIDIRNSYLFYFSIISLLYLILQVISNTKYYLIFYIHLIKIDFVEVLYYFSISLNIISIFYFIVNFINIQLLNFSISDEIRKSK